MKNKWYYWIKESFDCFITTAASSIIFGFIVSLGDKDIHSIKDAVNENIMFYFIIISMMFLCFYAYNNITNLSNITLSFGRTRREIFCGTQIFNIHSLLNIFILLILFNILSQKNFSTILMPITTYMALAFFSIGMGNFASASTLKNNSKVSCFIFQIAAMFIPIILLFFSGTIAALTDINYHLIFDNIAIFKTSEILATVISIIIGIVCYLGGSLKLKAVLYKLEARV